MVADTGTAVVVMVAVFYCFFSAFFFEINFKVEKKKQYCIPQTENVTEKLSPYHVYANMLRRGSWVVASIAEVIVATRLQCNGVQ